MCHLGTSSLTTDDYWKATGRSPFFSFQIWVQYLPALLATRKADVIKKPGIQVVECPERGVGNEQTYLAAWKQPWSPREKWSGGSTEGGVLDRERASSLRPWPIRARFGSLRPKWNPHINPSPPHKTFDLSAIFPFSTGLTHQTDSNGNLAAYVRKTPC